MKHSLLAGGVSYLLILAAFAAVAKSFGVAVTAPAILSFALLFLPYWAFGFGAAEPLRRRLPRPSQRLAVAATLIIPYLVFVQPIGAFRWGMFLGLLAFILAITVALECRQPWIALILLALAVELPWFHDAWPSPGLSALPKLLFVDAGLFGFLVVHPIGGIGFHLRVRLRDWIIGLREFLFFLPIALPLGLGLGFLHTHAAGAPLLRFAAAWIFTLFFVAIPEEIFFRGLVLNLLEARWGTRRALIVSALLFGLAHFPKRAVFNWRYVILAAIAGVFYGRAWLDRRRVLTSGITHATVDAVWSIWLR